MKRFITTLGLPGLTVIWLAMTASPATAQVYGGWPGGAPPFIQGPTLADTIRNGCQASSDQARVTAQAAADMGQRVRSAAYQTQNFWSDYQNLQFQFQNLRATFAAVDAFVPQLQSPRASNAAAELEAGLNIISEAFAPVDQGTFNRDAIVRMCQVLKEALDVWRQELRKDAARLGPIR